VSNITMYALLWTSHRVAL